MTEPASTPSSPAAPAAVAAADTAVFGKYTAAHEAALDAESEPTPSATPPKDPVRPNAAPAPAAHASPAPAGATGDDTGDPDAGTDRDDAEPAPESAKPDAAAEPGPLSETDAIALARRAHADGDTDALDRALKAILPGSKGLSEFVVDGSRFAQFRATTQKAQKKLDARAGELDARENNVRRGLAQVEQLVQRYAPVEALLQAAAGDSPESVDAFVSLIEKATGKPLNETVKRHIDKKLAKPGDPELEAVKRELRAEKEKREAREKSEETAREHQARTQQIQRHLVFLDETLSKHGDERVRELVKSPDGMKAIFQLQQRHFDARTNRTLTAEQAALKVLDEKQKEIEPWQRVLTRARGAAPTPSEPAQTTAAPTQTTPRALPLGARGAASASGTGARQLDDKDIFEKYERLQKLSGD